MELAVAVGLEIPSHNQRLKAAPRRATSFVSFWAVTDRALSPLLSSVLPPLCELILKEKATVSEKVNNTTKKVEDTVGLSQCQVVPRII